MERPSMEWPCSAISLEPLRPLSPKIPDNEEITTIDFNVDKLFYNETAGKLLYHLDGFFNEESIPFDCFSNEKSTELPLFETQSYPTPYKFENYVDPIHHYPFAVESVNCEQHSPVPNDGRYDAVQTHPAYFPSPTYDASAKTFPFKPNEEAERPQPLPETPQWPIIETLTPPDSPKDEDILKLLQDLEPEDIEQLVTGRVEDFDSTVTSFSENSCSNDDKFSEYGGSSPCVASDSGLDDPPRSQPSDVKPSTRVPGKNRRARKPYTKRSVEDRKARKKEQNKNAAIRYRSKKKAECQGTKQEEQLLQEQNDKLKSQLDDVTREIRYLKSLMRQAYRKNGLIK